MNPNSEVRIPETRKKPEIRMGKPRSEPGGEKCGLARDPADTIRASGFGFRTSEFRMNTLVATLALLILASPSAFAGNTIIDFEQDVPGQPPKGFTLATTGAGKSRWTVEADVSTPGATNVLKQSAALANASFPLCLKDDVQLRDGFVEAKFKTVSGTNDQAAGVVWRAQSSTNYYICRANALEDNVVLYKVQDGRRTALDIVGRKGGYGVKTPVASGAWHTLRVEFAGPRFTVMFDGRALFAAEDNTFAGPGRIGIWTKADSVAEFDDFMWGGS
jgi:hypothetical protein